MVALLSGIYVLYFILDRILTKFLERLDSIEVRHYDWEKASQDRLDSFFQQIVEVCRAMEASIHRLRDTIEANERTIRSHEILFERLFERLKNKSRESGQGEGH